VSIGRVINNAEKVQMFLVYGKCDGNSREAARMYAQQYPGRYHPPHSYFQKLDKNFGGLWFVH